MRLIDADALIFELEEWKKNPNNDDSAVDLVNHFIGIIKAFPSAEPKTGKWVKVIDEETPNVTKWHYECDQCGAGRFENGQRYCSRCGAIMLGEDGEA